MFFFWDPVAPPYPIRFYNAVGEGGAGGARAVASAGATVVSVQSEVDAVLRVAEEPEPQSPKVFVCAGMCTLWLIGSTQKKQASDLPDRIPIFPIFFVSP
jgi:hypothetical protein